LCVDLEIDCGLLNYFKSLISSLGRLNKKCRWGKPSSFRGRVKGKGERVKEERNILYTFAC
jgi:hypothetical protein